MLQIPRVHGYGVPQIMSGWQRGEERREREKVREQAGQQWQQSMDLNKQKFEEQQKQNEHMRNSAIWDKYFKGTEQARKLAEINPIEGKKMHDFFVGTVQKLNSEFKSNIDYADASNYKQQEFKDIVDNVSALIQKGDKKSLSQAHSFITKAFGLKKINKEVYDSYISQISQISDPGYKPEYNIFTDDSGRMKYIEEGKDVPEGLRPYEKPFAPSGYKPTTKEEAFALKEAGATKIDLGGSGLKELNKMMAKDIVTTRKDAQGAISGLANLYEAKQLVESGIITGTGAEWITSLGNLLVSRLGFDNLKTPIQNTQAFAATMGTQVGQIIKQFGSGTGLSDADREYAEKVVGGKITMTEGAIKKLMSINEKAFKNVIKNYNKSADQIMAKEGSSDLLFNLRLEMPQPKKLKEVTTQAEYDALPSGALYLENGEEYRKP